MGYSTALPLFRIVGFGPLGLPLTTQAYGTDFSPLSEPGNPRSEAAGAFLMAGTSQPAMSASGLAGGGRNRLFAGAADGTGGRLPSNPAPKNFVLKFLAGQSGRTPVLLEANREIVIGKEAGLDMVLAGDGVGRRHAKISLSGGRVLLQDLGSVGGTFVNGSKVSKVELKEGDRIMIGNVIFRLNTSSETSPVSSLPPERVTTPPPPSSNRPSQPSQKMSGLIEVISLPDLLQLLAASRKNGVVVINSDRGEGKIHLRDGRVSYCTINDSTVLKPQKAFYRLLTWSQGVFNLDAPFSGTLPEDLNASVESLLMEGVYQSDEVRRIEADAPKPGSKLTANLQAGRLRDLNPVELDVFQTVLARETLEEVLDNFEGSDLEAYTQLIALVQKGFVVVS